MKWAVQQACGGHRHFHQWEIASPDNWLPIRLARLTTGLDTSRVSRTSDDTCNRELLLLGGNIKVFHHADRL